MIQIVCVIWGDKYDASHVNRIHRAVMRHATRPIRFVCMSDAPRKLHPSIVVKPFPPFAGSPERMQIGCRRKLGMFAEGVLEPDLPTIYIDLDTVVLGDVARLADELERNPGMFMLRNHFLQWWRLPGRMKRMFGRSYYFGNSSILGFYPRDFTRIYTRFNEEIAGAPPIPAKHLHNDERFISHVAGDRVRVFSTRVANKFAEEYMTRFEVVEAIRKRLPWVRRRRDNMVAMTFVNAEFKPARLLKLRKGDLLRYKKARIRWDHDRYAAFYREPL